MYYIGSSSTPHNERRPFVYHGVPDSSPLMIARRAGCEKLSSDVSLQFLDRCFSNIESPSRSDDLQVSNAQRGRLQARYNGFCYFAVSHERILAYVDSERL